MVLILSLLALPMSLSLSQDHTQQTGMEARDLGCSSTHSEGPVLKEMFTEDREDGRWGGELCVVYRPCTQLSCQPISPICCSNTTSNETFSSLGGMSPRQPLYPLERVTP